MPHHLVAADLIARAFQMTDPRTIDKVIVLFPDHFKQSSLAFATTRRAFSTVFGRIDISETDARQLLTAKDLVNSRDLFARDHGIGAVLPFIKYYLPAAKIVPIAVSIGSRQQDSGSTCGTY